MKIIIFSILLATTISGNSFANCKNGCEVAWVNPISVHTPGEESKGESKEKKPSSMIGLKIGMSRKCPLSRAYFVFNKSKTTPNTAFVKRQAFQRMGSSSKVLSYPLNPGESVFIGCDKFGGVSVIYRYSLTG